MISSTSSSNRSRLVASVIVLALLLVSLGKGLHLLSWLAGEPYLPHNAQLEGSRILARRLMAGSDEYATEADVLMVGSSRMMADCNARIVAEEIARVSGSKENLRAINLGNVGSDFAELTRRLLRQPIPRIFILEFSPHMLSQGGSAPVSASSGVSFEAYRSRRAIAEMQVSGLARRTLEIEGMVHVRPVDMPTIWHVLTKIGSHEANVSHLYYLLRTAEGYAQKLRPDGQVYYHSFLPDRRSADIIRPVLGIRGGFNYTLLAEPVNPAQLQDLQRVLDVVTKAGGRTVIWRPPVDRRLYEIENRDKASGIRQLLSLLSEIGTRYVDMNPHGYSTSDLSHVDWFDIARLSKDLAAKIVSTLRHHERNVNDAQSVTE